MQEVLKVFKSPEYENGFLKLQSFSCDEGMDDLILVFCIVLGDNSEQIWQVRCIDFDDYNIVTIKYQADIRLFDDHVLLLDQNSIHMNLYFSKPPKDIDSFLGKLLMAHQRKVGGAIPISKYARIDYDLLKKGFGFFASGPQNIMNDYQKVLDEFGMKPSCVKNESPRYHEDNYRIMLFGDSYVIAKGFKAERLKLVSGDNTNA